VTVKPFALPHFLYSTSVPSGCRPCLLAFFFFFFFYFFCFFFFFFFFVFFWFIYLFFFFICFFFFFFPVIFFFFSFFLVSFVHTLAFRPPFPPDDPNRFWYGLIFFALSRLTSLHTYFYPKSPLQITNEPVPAAALACSFLKLHVPLVLFLFVFCTPPLPDSLLPACFSISILLPDCNLSRV